jgi:glycosyltransferase involved in cell wall biosynthesis
MLIILSTHPVQYHVPLWQALARDNRVPFQVWYLTDHGTRPALDRDFGKTFAWDIDTLSGYSYRFLEAPKNATPSSFARCRLTQPLAGPLSKVGAKAVWVLGWQVAAYWQAIRQTRREGIEVWLRGESNDLARVSGWKKPLKRMQLGYCFQRVNRFLYIGAPNRRLYKKYGVADGRLYPAPYAVDNERFAQQAEALRPRRANLRRQLGIPDNAFCILFCGKFVPKKRPMDIILAAQQLIASGSLPNVHLLFVGAGVLGPQLRQSCRVIFDADAPTDGTRAITASEFIPPASFVGFLNQTELSQAYVAADCLVLPSDHRETWGLVVNEALSSGLTCIASDACGCTEDLLGDQGSFPVGDIRAIASKLLHIATDKLNYKQPPEIHETVSAVVRAYRDTLLSKLSDRTLAS